MAKSKIIKDLALGNTDLFSALKRAKLLFTSLNDDTLIKWVNHEIVGYPDEKQVPTYRTFQGNLVGSYLTRYWKYEKCPIPLGNMPQNIREGILTVKIREGVNELKALSQSAPELASLVIPPDLLPALTRYIGFPLMRITYAKVPVEPHWCTAVLSSVENRLLDSLLLLENEFGNLDDLDIDHAPKSSSLSEIASQIHLIVYNDHSVDIGNGNKINDSSIASGK